MNFKFVLMMCIAPLTFAQSYYQNKDADSVGTDDKIAKFLGYVVQGFNAILNGGELPAAPKELHK